MDPKLREMFKGLGVRNGVLNIQFFVDDERFYAYDPGFRLQGEGPHFFIQDINGFDNREMLINYALTGSMGVVDMEKKILIKDVNIESKCGWSPFNGVEFKGTPVATIIAGKTKMKDGKILGEPEGTPLKFN